MKSPRVSEELLRKTLNETNSLQEAAKALGVNRRTVYRWMDFYKITRRTEFDKAA
jgi:transcriptional regulator with PAS, ATPase and Fis domain